MIDVSSDCGMRGRSGFIVIRMNFSGSSDAGLACSAAQPAAQPIATKPVSQPVHRALICRQVTLLRRKLPSKKDRAADITNAVPELTAPDRGVWGWVHKASSLRRVNGGGIEEAQGGAG
jgi:hypothetical protein